MRLAFYINTTLKYASRCVSEYILYKIGDLMMDTQNNRSFLVRTAEALVMRSLFMFSFPTQNGSQADVLAYTKFLFRSTNNSLARSARRPQSRKQ